MRSEESEILIALDVPFSEQSLTNKKGNPKHLDMSGDQRRRFVCISRPAGLMQFRGLLSLKTDHARNISIKISVVSRPNGFGQIIIKPKCWLISAWSRTRARRHHANSNYFNRIAIYTFNYTLGPWSRTCSDTFLVQFPRHASGNIILDWHYLFILPKTYTIVAVNYPSVWEQRYFSLALNF